MFMRQNLTISFLFYKYINQNIFNFSVDNDIQWQYNEYCKGDDDVKKENIKGIVKYIDGEQCLEIDGF